MAILQFTGGNIDPPCDTEPTTFHYTKKAQFDAKFGNRTCCVSEILKVVEENDE